MRGGEEDRCLIALGGGDYLIGAVLQREAVGDGKLEQQLRVREALPQDIALFRSVAEDHAIERVEI